MDWTKKKSQFSSIANAVAVIEEVKDQNELQAMSRYPLKHTVVLVHFESPTEMFLCLSICKRNKKVLMTTYVFIIWLRISIY
jgi:hypothetical protein